MDSEGIRRKPFSALIKMGVKLILRVILMTLCFLVYLAILPIFFVVMVPLYIYRFIVIIAQKLLKPSWVGIMSTRDALVGLDNINTRCECMITLLLVLKGPGNIDLFRKVFEKEVIEGKNSQGEFSYLKLTYYFEKWLGFTFWKREENFQLSNHIREFHPPSDDPNNNSEFVTEKQLMKGLGDIATKPFAKGVSPWEALLIPKYKRSKPKLHHDVKSNVKVEPVDIEEDKDVESAIVLRIHHAIGDGYSIMKLVVGNLCGDPLSLIPKAPVRKISAFNQIIQYIAIICLTPYYHFMQFFFNIDRTIWHLKSDDLKKEWSFTMSERLSFEGLKETSNKFGVCVTATLLAGLAGGIHNFLEKKGHGKRNRRVMRGLTPMPWKGHPMDALVNHWTVGVFDLPVHEPCPRKRLMATHKSADNLKKSPILLTNFITVPMLLGAPNWMTDFWGTNWMTTMIISNFPGPNYPTRALYKTQYIDDVISWVPHMRGSAGLGVMFISYNGGVRVSISVDNAILKGEELDELCQSIGQEFINLGSLQVTLETTV